MTNNFDYDENTNMTTKNDFMKLRHDKKIKYDNFEILKKNFEFANVQKLKTFW